MTRSLRHSKHARMHPSRARKQAVFVLFLCVLAAPALAQTQVCTPIDSDRILAQDLAAVLPAFAALPPQTLLAPTPPPASQRTFHHAELISLAERYGLAIDADSAACFERAMEPLDRDRVLAAMRAALDMPDARIELSETSLYPVPKGKIEFVLAHLGMPATPDQRAPVLWRGDIIYGDDHHFAVWARVRIFAQRTKIVAAETLKPGHKIDRPDLRVVIDEGFPAFSKSGLSTDQLVGMIPLRPIAAGTAVTLDLVALPNDINRGDLIEIEVRSGAARLVLTARAESGGRDGDSISVRNLESNKIFTAQIAGKGRAVVITDSLKAE